MKSLRNFDFGFVTNKKKIWFSISIAILFVGLVFMLIFGVTGNGVLNIGIDFTGGTQITVQVDSSVMNAHSDDLKKDIEDVLKDEDLSFSPLQKTTDGYTAKFMDKKGVDDQREYRESVIAKIKAVIYDNYYNGVESNVVKVSAEHTSATTSGELVLNALLCTLIALVLILIYIAIRFELLSGLSAIIGLCHDIIIMTAFMAIFRVQINAPFVAAMITIIGYSINNTIVVFDRIREIKRSNVGGLTNKEVVNSAVKNTITRSINTSITTLFTIIVLFIAGVSSIKEFALPIIIGLLAGTYSSIFVAPSLWQLMIDSHEKRKANKKAYQGIVNEEKLVEQEAIETSTNIANVSTKSSKTSKSTNYKNYKKKSKKK